MHARRLWRIIVKRQVTWKSLVREVVEHKLPRSFTLRDVEAYGDYFAEHYPENKFLAAKIRQSLQVLRDQGFIRFLGGGRYERTGIAQPIFSPFFDPSVAEGFVSKSQIARVTIETWAELMLYCLSCTADELARLPASTPIADLRCDECSRRYQIKGKNGRFGDKVPSSAYEPLVAAARSGSMPDYVLVEYDPRLNVVVFASAIAGRHVGEERLLPRRPLSRTARRSGWRGCTIDIAGLDEFTVRIVEPAGLDRHDVRARWSGLS
jgi:hypothetical protein